MLCSLFCERWVNEDLTRNWVQGVLGKFLFTYRMLACRMLAQAKIDPVTVPGGCTKYIQAPHVAWDKYNAWND